MIKKLKCIYTRTVHNEAQHDSRGFLCCNKKTFGILSIPSKSILNLFENRLEGVMWSASHGLSSVLDVCALKITFDE